MSEKKQELEVAEKELEDSEYENVELTEQLEEKEDRIKGLEKALVREREDLEKSKKRSKDLDDLLDNRIKAHNKIYDQLKIENDDLIASVESYKADIKQYEKDTTKIISHFEPNKPSRPGY